MENILAQIANPKNFGKFVVEVQSWENDGDHYENHIFFAPTREEFDDLVYACKIMCGQVNPELDGIEFPDRETFLEYILEKELDQAYFDEDTVFHHEFLTNLVGSYEYESNVLRTGDCFMAFYLDCYGKLNPVNVD